MTITVTNQKPAFLEAWHQIACTGDYDPMPAITRTVVDPLHDPLNTNHPVAMANSSGQPIAPGQITDILMRCLGEHPSPADEQVMKEVLGQTLINFDQASTLPVNELFAIQYGHVNKMPPPGPRTIYNAQDDVIPSAKGVLAGKADPYQFFAALAYTFHPNTLGFWFQSSAAFDDFKTWLAQQTQTMSAALPIETTNLLNQFTQLSLRGLTESLLLRKDDDDGNEEHSFARLLIHMLMGYSAQVGYDEFGILPFTLSELFCPRSLVLVNLEAHARSTPLRVSNEWKLINTSLSSPVKVISHKNLSKLTTLPRAAAKARAMAARQTPGQPGNRSARVKFRKQPPSKLDLFKDITRVLRRMGKVNKSQNIFRRSKTTFLKANRREPDDWNKPGRITSVHYMPDLHIYIDTSGSISEENYQEAVLMLIKIAKKLNVNLYFNSFSHLLSQEIMLHVANKSIAQIWKEFRRIPKVTGGTEYKQIWDYVNASTVRKRRLSLVVTDFEWYPPSTREDHPPNLYYAPCSSMDWTIIIASAENFAAGMRHIDPAIKQRLLGMII